VVINNYSIKVYLILFTILVIAVVNTDKTVLAKNVFLDEKPIAVMVGNSPKERVIQKGINEADVIYEIEVEFPFTRYMAIFLEDTETIVGPVRSSRYYFSRICAEWSAIFAHCGGQNLKNAQILDIDEIHSPSPFWRDENIGSWINLFVNTAELRKEAKKQNTSISYNQNTHNLLNLRKPDINKDDQIHKITIKYNANYIISYEYHTDEKKYYRYINQKPHYDQGCRKQIKVSNIIIQFTLIEKIVGDDQNRVQVELIGEGTGRVFLGGNHQSVRWVKKTKDDQTLFLDRDGNPVTYNPGVSWVHLVSPNSEIWVK